MTRALVLTIATLLAAPALADGSAPKAEPAPASAGAVTPPAAGSADRAKPDAGRGSDLRAHPRTDKPGARDAAEPRRSGAPAAKPAPCVEVKPCSID